MAGWKDRLVKGYQAFRAGDFKEQKALYETLGTKGQNPEVMLIGCADSRVDPSDIFNAYPGEMFVARNVANLVPPFDASDGFHGTSAAIEYAVTVLGVKAIVILGHESCGGIAGCLAGMGEDPEAGFVGRWVSLINDVRDRVVANASDETDKQNEMEHEAIRQSLENLMTFPFVREAVEDGRLELQGAYFSITKARLMMANEKGEFVEVRPE